MCARVNQPLHAAIAADHLQVVRLLLTRGMLVPDSAIELARKLGHDNLLELLEKWKALVIAGAPYDSAAEPELPLVMPIAESVPEARNHHFIVDEKAGENVTQSARVRVPMFFCAVALSLWCCQFF